MIVIKWHIYKISCFISQANDAVSLSKSPFLSSSTNSSRTNGRSSSSMASSTNKRASGRDGATFGRKDFQQPPMLPSDPPGTRRQQQQQHPSGLGGQIIDKNWDYISGATTLGGGNSHANFNFWVLKLL